MIGNKLMVTMGKGCWVAKSRPTLWDLMDCSKQGCPVLHYLPEFAQTHVHWVSDAISSSVSLFFSRPQSFPASFPMSRLFASGGHRVGASASTSVLSMNTQGWFPLGLTSLISFLFNGPSKVFSNTTVWKQFFSTQPSLYSNCHIYTWLLEKW